MITVGHDYRLSAPGQAEEYLSEALDLLRDMRGHLTRDEVLAVIQDIEHAHTVLVNAYYAFPPAVPK